jgi:dinuclear metal center YbgI/SA1388 family protein
VRLGELIKVIDRRYPQEWAASWDAVGLTVGDPDREIRSILFAVDPVEATVSEALEMGADLLITHHPLFLRGVHSVAATSFKGRLVHRLIEGGCGLFTAHTNADVARPGVSDALAEALGLMVGEALVPAPAGLEKIITFVPTADTPKVIDALSAAGAGHIGNYSRVAFASAGRGMFTPEQGANPAIGEVGRPEVVDEERIEMIFPGEIRNRVIAALGVAHPYEEVAYDVVRIENPDPLRGTGRIGLLDQPVSLSDFVGAISSALPIGPGGVRYAGDPARVIRRVAVCGGSGDEFIPAARHADVDAYVTADLRHHPVSEAMESDGPALIDVGHFASEWPWLRSAASGLTSDLQQLGITVAMQVSTLSTDPWVGMHHVTKEHMS